MMMPSALAGRAAEGASQQYEDDWQQQGRLLQRDSDTHRSALQVRQTRRIHYVADAGNPRGVRALVPC